MDFCRRQTKISTLTTQFAIDGEPTVEVNVELTLNL